MALGCIEAVKAERSSFENTFSVELSEPDTFYLDGIAQAAIQDIQKLRRDSEFKYDMTDLVIGFDVDDMINRLWSLKEKSKSQLEDAQKYSKWTSKISRSVTGFKDPLRDLLGEHYVDELVTGPGGFVICRCGWSRESDSGATRSRRDFLAFHALHQADQVRIYMFNEEDDLSEIDDSLEK